MNNTKKTSKISIRLVTSMTFFIIPVYIILSSSQIAQAGLFSFVYDWIGTGFASTLDTSNASGTNSQTVDILSAAVNPNPNPDNLFEVSPVDHGTLIPDIAATNSSTTNEILNTQISTYTVHSGDTVESVAKLFSVSKNTILWANELTNKSILSEGQVLVILPITGIKYTVKKGDTVASIAKKFGGNNVSETLGDILAYNELTNSSSLSVGDEVIIPDAEMPVVSINSAVSYTASGKSKLTVNVSKYKSYSSCSTPTPGCYYLRPIVGGRKSQGLHDNNAVDLAVAIGTPIHASAAGTVLINRMDGGWNGKAGNFVIIAHDNGTQTVYSHMLTKPVVTVGQHVEQGDTIGYVGLTGHTTGPHVHFELHGARNPF